MQLHLSDVESVQFAEDTTIIFGHQNITYLKYCVERELEVLSDWFRANKLTLNVDKSVFILFNRGPLHCDINDLKLGNKTIKRVKETKFLGLWVDEQLNWKSHLRRLKGKIKCGLGMLIRSNLHLTTRAKKLLYYGQVHSHLCYGLGVWDPMLNEGQINELKTLQNKCLKLVASSLPGKDSRSKLNILGVDHLIELEQCKLGYKLCHQMLPTALTTLIKHDQYSKDMTKSHTYLTRQKSIPHQPKVKLNVYRNSFLYQTISCFSNLPIELQRLHSLHYFTNRVKKLLLTNC